MRTSETGSILLVEDDADMLAVVASLLEPQSSRLLVARSGREGLTKLQATAEHMVVVSSGVLQDMTADKMLAAVVRDGGLARRHAFVLITPEQGDMPLVRKWQSQLPLFALLEPYSYDELCQAVSRAAECVALSRELYGAPAGTRRGGQRHLDVAPVHDGAAEGAPNAALADLPEQADRARSVASTGVLVLGGERGMRQFIAHLLTRDPFVVTHTDDDQVALTWLRSCAEPMIVLLNATPSSQHAGLMHMVTEEARLVRHSYVLLTPPGFWPSERQRELVALLNAPVVKKPISPTAFRKAIEAIAEPPVGAASGADGSVPDAVPRRDIWRL